MDAVIDGARGEQHRGERPTGGQARPTVRAAGVPFSPAPEVAHLDEGNDRPDLEVRQHGSHCLRVVLHSRIRVTFHHPARVRLTPGAARVVARAKDHFLSGVPDPDSRVGPILQHLARIGIGAALPSEIRSARVAEVEEVVFDGVRIGAAATRPVTDAPLGVRQIRIRIQCVRRIDER